MDYDRWLASLDPYNNEPKAVYECAWCGKDIYDGDDCFDIDNEYVCPDCIDGCKTTAEAKEREIY